MVQVKTNYGVVEGVMDKEHNSVLYAGIPFAAPPVGELRFRAPEPPKPWSGVLDCKKFRSASMQHIIPVPSPFYPCYGQEYFITNDDSVSEDCLYLNIWAPANRKKNDRLPVLFIIHGGGWTTGTGAIPVISGKNLAAEGVVIVTVNYRLGALGFLAHPDLAGESSTGTSGNYAIMDQIAALEWVKENIIFFGGDPENVTIAGESAGAGSVSVLCNSPRAKGLFHKAVAQSGTCETKTNVIGKTPEGVKEAEAQGAKLVKERWNCNSIEELRRLPAEEFINIKVPWGPVRDGYVWAYEGKSLNGINDIPMLIGSNSDEGKTFCRPDITQEQLDKEFKIRYGNYYEQIKQVYQNGYSDITERNYAETRDRGFEFPMYYWAIRFSEYAKSPVFLYYFDRPTPGNDFGAFHTSNLKYFYQNMDCGDIPWEAADWELSRAMKGYLLSFLKTGNPNSEDNPRWDAYNKNKDQVMELGSHIGMIDKPHKEAMNILMQVYG